MVFFGTVSSLLARVRVVSKCLHVPQQSECFLAAGAALSLHTALLHPGRLGGVVAMSGWLPCPDETLAELPQLSASTPFLLIHGDADTLVSPGWGQDAHDTIKRLGYMVCTGVRLFLAACLYGHCPSTSRGRQFPPPLF